MWRELGSWCGGRRGISLLLWITTCQSVFTEEEPVTEAEWLCIGFCTECIKRWKKEFFQWVLITVFLMGRNQEKLVYLALIEFQNSEYGRRWGTVHWVQAVDWPTLVKCCRCGVEGWRPVFLLLRRLVEIIVKLGILGIYKIRQMWENFLAK